MVESFHLKSLSEEDKLIVSKPFLSTEQIQQRIKELSAEISRDYEGKKLLSVGILRGAFMFFADLVRSIQVPMEVDFLNVSSYVKAETSGEIKIHTDLRENIRGKDILLIEDIVDTGLTLNYIKNMLLERQPASLRICAFLDKKPRRKADVALDYVGFEIPDEYIVGYGLDYDNKFRNLPYIAIFKKSL
ncbi:MAG: hypoxanthine phosphoribosyltransferase [Nitrospirae bacterium]|nr:hypoxanthine phosphoribosyltransferase [Nitrospirota bacterium]